MLYLVRHALPDAHFYNNLPPGPGLGETGRLQSEWIGRAMFKKQIAKIYCSDFTRAMDSIEPFRIQNPLIPFEICPAFREREPSIESHESLKLRVFEKMNQLLDSGANSMMIVSHCGPINMILELLDSEQKCFHYPYRSPHGCLTPIAGIWEINLDSGTGELIQCPISNGTEPNT